MQIHEPNIEKMQQEQEQEQVINSVVVINNKFVNKQNDKLLNLYKEKDELLLEMIQIMDKVKKTRILIRQEFTIKGCLVQIEKSLKRLQLEKEINKNILCRERLNYRKVDTKCKKLEKEIDKLEENMRFRNEKHLDKENRKEELILAKKRINLKTIFNKLPDDVLWYMSKFFTYETQIELLESKCKFSTRLNNLSNDLVSSFYTKVRMTHDYYSLLTPDQKTEELNETWYSIKYCGSQVARRAHFNKIMYQLKKERPATALKMLKTFAILFGSADRKYKVNEELFRKEAERGMF